MDINPKLLSSIMSELARESHRKSPRNKAYYRKIRAIGVAKQKAKKKLSP